MNMGSLSRFFGCDLCLCAAWVYVCVEVVDGRSLRFLCGGEATEMDEEGRKDEAEKTILLLIILFLFLSTFSFLLVEGVGSGGC